MAHCAPLTDKLAGEGRLFEREQFGYVVSNRGAEKHETQIKAPRSGQTLFQIASAVGGKNMTKGMYTR